MIPDQILHFIGGRHVPSADGAFGVASRCRVDTRHLAPHEVAARIADAAEERCASLTGHG